MDGFNNRWEYNSHAIYKHLCSSYNPYLGIFRTYFPFMRSIMNTDWLSFKYNYQIVGSPGTVEKIFIPQELNVDVLYNVSRSLMSQAFNNKFIKHITVILIKKLKINLSRLQRVSISLTELLLLIFLPDVVCTIRITTIFS